MKLVIGFIISVSLMFGQTSVTGIPGQYSQVPLPSNFIFLGAGVNQSQLNGQPVVGSFAWGHQMTGSLYSFTRADILGINKKPYSAQTVMTAGVCDITNQIGTRIFLGACADGGTSVSGTDIGGAVGADGIAGVRFGSKKNWAFVVMGGIVKTALSTAATPVRVGLAYGWGK